MSQVACLYRPVRLSYLETDQDCSREQLLQWQLALNATADFLARQPQGTVMAVPQLGLGFFLAKRSGDVSDLWSTDWSADEGLSWDSFTEPAADKHFSGQGWAADLAAILYAALLLPKKELEFVPGLRVELRPFVAATYDGEAVALT